ncbi:FKBP-type peptidyl-prolyl cis-trans isomerase [Mucilaginibacter sp. HMF5004]|nr:FKBP-type peptidyl-prolyl cis-trans isomerase [Mucilaginibacter rivuli]
MNYRSFLVLVLSLVLLNKANAQVTFEHTPKGASYHIFTANPGDKIKLSNVITFNVIQKTEKDSVLYSSYQSGRPVKLQVQASQNIADLMEIFPLLASKDSAIVKVPSDSVFVGHEEQRPPFLPKGSSIVFLLKVERVQTIDEAIAERNTAMEAMKSAEALALTKYVTESKQAYKTTTSGLKYFITKPSIKRKPLKGDTAYVNYVGHTLNGKVFDSSIEAVAKSAGLQQPGRTYEPIKVAVGEGQVIKGWDEALLLLNEGSKASLVIPSALAYGERGAGEDIPAFTPLVFELELVKVKAVPHVVPKTTAKKTTAKKATAKTTTVKTTAAPKKK